jgi:hypothetical protein
MAFPETTCEILQVIAAQMKETMGRMQVPEEDEEVLVLNSIGLEASLQAMEIVMDVERRLAELGEACGTVTEDGMKRIIGRVVFHAEGSRFTGNNFMNDSLQGLWVDLARNPRLGGAKFFLGEESIEKTMGGIWTLRRFKGLWGSVHSGALSVNMDFGEKTSGHLARVRVFQSADLCRLSQMNPPQVVHESGWLR